LFHRTLDQRLHEKGHIGFGLHLHGGAFARWRNVHNRIGGDALVGVDVVTNLGVGDLFGQAELAGYHAVERETAGVVSDAPVGDLWHGGNLDAFGEIHQGVVHLLLGVAECLCIALDFHTDCIEAAKI